MGCPVSRALSLLTLAVLWVGAVRLIVGARAGVAAGRDASFGRVRPRAGWVAACVAAFLVGVLSGPMSLFRW